MKKLIMTMITAAPLAAFCAGGYLKLDRDFASNDAPVAEETAKSPLFRKKIAFLGDSYVQNHHRPATEAWHCLLAQKHQMHYLNFGRNGNRMVFAHPKQGTVMMERFAEIPDDADYIVVIAGHNDANAINRLNGTHAVSDDSPETKAKRDEMIAQLKKGCREFISAIKARYPKAKLAFVTPWAVDSPYFPFVIDTIKSETAAQGVPCYDAASLSGINPNDPAFRKKYFQAENDTAHLNAEGHKLMLQKIEPFFLSL